MDNFIEVVEFIDLIIKIIVGFIDYIFGFFNYLLESCKGLLSGGNVLFFILFLLLIWKLVMKLKG